MNIGFLLRSTAKTIWGGDLICLKLMADGLKHFGYSLKFSDKIDQLLDCHFVFLTFSLHPLIDAYLALKKEKIPYAVIPFYENDAQFFTSSRGLSVFLYLINENTHNSGLEFSLDTLINRPHILDVFGPQTALRTSMNQKVFENAAFCLTNSHTESKNMQRDFARVITETIYWPAGLLTQKPKEVNDDILKITGLKSKSYLLQIGRIETRKNQLSTVLATRNLQYPLVFIASHCNLLVLDLLKTLILKYRKASTFILSQNLPSEDIGPLKIININDHYKMPSSLIFSAYKHAGLYIHPAFQELPGLTYLEALDFNIPIIASSWTTLKDYLLDKKSGKYLLDDRVTFCKPHHLTDIENAIKTHFGKRLTPLKTPLFNKSSYDLGRETDDLIKKYIR